MKYTRTTLIGIKLFFTICLLFLINQGTGFAMKYGTKRESNNLSQEQKDLIIKYNNLPKEQKDLIQELAHLIPDSVEMGSIKDMEDLREKMAFKMASMGKLPKDRAMMKVAATAIGQYKDDNHVETEYIKRWSIPFPGNNPYTIFLSRGDDKAGLSHILQRHVLLHATEKNIRKNGVSTSALSTNGDPDTLFKLDSTIDDVIELLKNALLNDENKKI
ncbi:hypothetical protein [Pasteuria penetrans]|uniref:hypothetical protein n=1 Tax=Pasteuria penetrans TaxID=86005 RepID=UPI0011ECE78F|nr:hypothetical protein [Pasteuria penetrans]